MWDSPGDSCPPDHESYPGEPLTSYTFNLQFQCDLCFWTNTSAAPGPTVHPACRLYSRVHATTWQILLTLSFNPANGFCSKTVPLAISLTKQRGDKPKAEPVEGSGLEVRHPISLKLLLLDARP